MSTTLHATPDTLAAVEPTLPPDGPIIVASDTTAGSDSAFPIAAVLAEHLTSEILALTVIEPMNIPVYGVDGMVVSLDTMAVPEAARDEAIRAQLTRLTRGPAWPVVIRTGEPAREITSAAGAMRSRLIVVGRGKHTSSIDRMFGGESVLQLVQQGDSPVLAAEDSLSSLPRRVVIATDFSPFSLYAAQVAMTLVAPDAQIWLVHVAPAFDESIPFLRDRAQLYRTQAGVAAAAFAASLKHGSTTIESVALSGRVSNQLLACISEHRADMIVTASHGYGFLRRMLLGSVATTIVRRAPCSVLVVPGSARTVAESRARTATNLQTRTLLASVLDGELAAFTRRNFGRLCHVEVDQDALGAQVLGHDLPLVGATFDRHRSEVALMFGTSTLKGMHLTHTIGDVTEVDVRSDMRTGDQVLRIAHDRGQTLVLMT